MNGRHDAVSSAWTLALFSVIVSGVAWAATCNCTEATSACNGYDFPEVIPGTDVCIYSQSGDTATFAMPYNDRGYDNCETLPVTSTCKYTLGKLFNGVCTSPGDPQEAEVTWDYAMGDKCALSCP